MADIGVSDRRSIWIVRANREGRQIYLDDYVSSIGAKEVKSKICNKARSQKDHRPADEILKEYGWEIVRIDFSCFSPVIEYPLYSWTE